MQTVEDVAADPVALESGGLREYVAGGVSRIVVDSPIEFNGGTGGEISGAPELGQHTDELLAELGLDAEEIRTLHASGAVGARVSVNGAVNGR